MLRSSGSHFFLFVSIIHSPPTFAFEDLYMILLSMHFSCMHVFVIPRKLPRFAREGAHPPLLSSPFIKSCIRHCILHLPEKRLGCGHNNTQYYTTRDTIDTTQPRMSTRSYSRSRVQRTRVACFACQTYDVHASYIKVGTPNFTKADGFTLRHANKS